MLFKSCGQGPSLSPAQIGFEANKSPGPTQLPQFLQQCCNPSLRYRTILILRHEHANAPHALALLRACLNRPRRRAAI
jgi:hypothetical protein